MEHKQELPVEVTVKQINEFISAVNEWTKRLPDAINTPLFDAIQSLNTTLSIHLVPLQSLSNDTKNKMNELLINMCDQHIIEHTQPTHPNQPPGINHKHIFIPVREKKTWYGKVIPAMDKYKEYLEKIKQINDTSISEHHKLLNAKVKIVPIYPEKYPSFALFPENKEFRKYFIPFVVRPKPTL